MKKMVFLILILLMFVFVPDVSSQMMRGLKNVVGDHTKKEEMEGRQIWEKLQKKEIDCQKLTDDQFEVLGEYFMGLSLGERHSAMNQMMKQMMGEAGEKQAHINIGKKYSGCFGNNINNFNFMPMMGMMGGFGNSMMRWGWGFFGWLGFLYWGLIQVLILLILVLLVIYLLKKIKS